jgi:hypothetical protein
MGFLTDFFLAHIRFIKKNYDDDKNIQEAEMALSWLALVVVVVGAASFRPNGGQSYFVC